jgi:hypothetical protein
MTHSTRPVGNRAGSLWVSAALFVFAAVLAFRPFPYVSAVTQPVAVPAWATDTTPVRQPRLRPEYTAGVFQYRCSECHHIIPSPIETSRTLTQHTEIQLEHGINTRCFNCHHRTNRDAFVDDYGREIPWDQPQLLCSKCHGPVYRDWQHGSHGRSNGYWDKSRGTQTRMVTGTSQGALRRGGGASSVTIRIARHSHRWHQRRDRTRCAWDPRDRGHVMKTMILCGWADMRTREVPGPCRKERTEP